MVTYRLMTPGDIPAGLALCRAAGWNQLACDWKVFLHLSPGGCLVAVKEGKVVGTVTTLRYQHCFSWIGMVLVEAACQRQGIGLQLLNEALHLLHKEPTIRLDATPAGREVYKKLGFVDEYGLSRMVCLDPVSSGSPSRVRSMDKNDLGTVAAFDRASFGADRQSLLEWMWEGAPQLAFVNEEKNEVQGYCLGREGYHFTHIGPVIAHHFHIAQQLVAAAMNHCKGKAIVLDVPSFHPKWKTWLIGMGFTEQRPFLRMYKGHPPITGSPGKQFAILGPEFG
jgi:ribosomal protein S18 acetylase RimI-like enzyme